MFQVPAGDRAAREKARAEFNAAAEGWLFDPSDRRGVLHVRIKPQPLASGFVVNVVLQGSQPPILTVAPSGVVRDDEPTKIA
jgi:hypothetical protein